MGWDCICGSSVGTRDHYCQAVQREVAQAQLDLLTEIINELRFARYPRTQPEPFVAPRIDDMETPRSSA